DAYLAFAELFFDEATRDPSKWPLAAKAYDEVLGFPPPGNVLWGYAQYKKAYVAWNQGELTKALDGFQKVIRFTLDHPTIPSAPGLGRAARRDLVPIYAEVGAPEKAWAFFEALAPKATTSARSATLSNLEELGQAYLDRGHYAEAITLHRDTLMKRGPDEKRCGYHAKVAEATMALAGSDKPRVVAVLNTQRDLFLAMHEDRKHPVELQNCEERTASLLTETAMAWHLEAVGSGGVRGTNDAQTMDAAEALYRVAVEAFEPERFARLRFPHLVREDWPTAAKVRYALGDLLFHRKKWQACGGVFQQAFEVEPAGNLSEEALFASADCWSRASHQRVGEATPSDGLKARPLDDEERRMMQALDRYACHIVPNAADTAARDRHVDVLLARARSYAIAGQHDKAALAFRQVAFDFPESEAAVGAARRYVESLEILRRHWGRAACLAPMKADVPPLLARQCKKTDGADQARTDDCEALTHVATDMRKIGAADLVARADRQKTGRRELYREACDAYLAIWREEGEGPCRANEPRCKERGFDVVLYNGAQACQAAHLLAKSISIRKVLIDPELHLQDTEAARKAVYEIGANYQAIAVYDQAASYYERFAAESPEDPKAPTALADAIVLRLGLGQSDDALEAASDFASRYATKRPQEAALVAFAVGAHHAAHERWGETEKVLRAAMPRIDEHGSADVRVQARAVLGRAYQALGRSSQASQQFAALRDRSAELSWLREAIEAQDEPLPTRRRRWAKSLDAIGEALFFFAEQEREKADAIAFPRFRGSRDSTQAVQRFIDSEVKRWLAQKKPAIDRAAAAYAKVLGLASGEPPPRWAIASGAAIGGMWGGLVEAFLDAPYPAKWDEPGFVPGSDPPTLWQELRASYKAGLADAVKPYRQAAKQAHADCLQNGILFQHFDDRLQSCERWLAKNYPLEYHLVDELKDTPTRVNSGLSERRLAITMDGAAVRRETSR
ncbi:MAG: hypothetical protein KC731_33175, partial [Myxococcales bacterium]|nr:hypothetical protein [Myxococcales bacterium]